MRRLVVVFFLAAALISCKKEKTDPIDNNPETDQTDYFPLSIGNYWIYQHFEIDSLNHETEKQVFDSIAITADTIYRNNKYYVLEGTNYPFNGGQWGFIEMLRDSSGYIVNQNGIIKFTDDNFVDTLAFKTEVHNGDTLYTLFYKMEKPSDNIEVPLGSFNVLNYRGTLNSSMEIQGSQNPRYLNTFYADSVGKILETYFFLHSPLTNEKRLVRYHIE